MEILIKKKEIDQIITSNPEKYILNKINEIFKEKPKKLSKIKQVITRTSGVYLIYRGKKKIKNIVYIGETDDLYRRIIGDLSRGKLRYNHTFLGKVARDLGYKNYLISSHNKTRKVQISKNEVLKIEKRIKGEIGRHYLFAYIGTKDKELAFLIEGILIRHFVKNFPGQLWNKPKKYQKISV